MVFADKGCVTGRSQTSGVANCSANKEHVCVCVSHFHVFMFEHLSAFPLVHCDSPGPPGPGTKLRPEIQGTSPSRAHRRVVFPEPGRL